MAFRDDEDVVVGMGGGPPAEHVVPVGIPAQDDAVRADADAIAQEEECLADVGEAGVVAGIFERVVTDGVSEDGDVAGDTKIFGEEHEEVELLIAGLLRAGGRPAETAVVEQDVAVGEGALHDEAEGGAGVGVAEGQSVLGLVAHGADHAPGVVVDGALGDDGFVVVLAPGGHLLEDGGVPAHFAAEAGVGLVGEGGDFFGPVVGEGGADGVVCWAGHGWSELCSERMHGGVRVAGVTDDEGEAAVFAGLEDAGGLDADRGVGGASLRRNRDGICIRG